MPLRIEIIRAAEFIRVGAEGRFDLAASKAALARIAGACRKRGIENAVLDLRKVQTGPKPVFSTSDLLELVNAFPELGFTDRQRLAILYRVDPHKRARLFAFASALHGWRVSAFGDFERAMAWLSSDQETQTQPKQASLTKPVRVRILGQGSPGWQPQKAPPRPRADG